MIGTSYSGVSGISSSLSNFRSAGSFHEKCRNFSSENFSRGSRLGALIISVGDGGSNVYCKDRNSVGNKISSSRSCLNL